MACSRLTNRTAVKVLVGGLGMGFTVSAALAQLPPDATVVVAELVPEVVRWNEEVLGECAGLPLRDGRVRVCEVDVGSMLREARDDYDAILLDVDNGPEGMVRRQNDDLYSVPGLAHAYRALRAGGILAVWSAGRSQGFVRRLRKVGFTVEECRLRAHGHKGAHHTIWFATSRQ
jgi:spermidine synthase